MTMRQKDIDILKEANKKMIDDLEKVIPQIESLKVKGWKPVDQQKKIRCQFSQAIEYSQKYHNTMKVSYLQISNEKLLSIKTDIKELADMDILKTMKKDIREKEATIRENLEKNENYKKEIIELKEAIKSNEKIILTFPRNFFKNTPDPMDNTC